MSQMMYVKRCLRLVNEHDELPVAYLCVYMRSFETAFSETFLNNLDHVSNNRFL